MSRRDDEKRLGPNRRKWPVGRVAPDDPKENTRDHERLWWALEHLKRTPGPQGPPGAPASSAGGGTWTEVMAETPDLMVWHRMGDAFVPAATVSDALLDSATYDGESPRNMDWVQSGGSSVTPAQSNAALSADDDGCPEWAGTPDSYFTPTGFTTGLTTHDQPFRWSYSLRSLSFWFRFDGDPTYNATFNPWYPIIGNATYQGPSGTPGWLFYIDTNNAGGPTLTLWGPSGAYAIVGPVVNVGQWYFVALTWDTATYRLYIDGAAAGTYASASALDVNALPPLYGHTRGHSGFSDFNLTWDGAIDEVAWWGRALTAAEVFALYTGAVSGGDEASGKVDTADGIGGSSWEFPTIETRLNGA